jgi:aldose 1-epimerase
VTIEVLRAGDATVSVDPEDGCRITSFEVLGLELLVTAATDPIYWGWYVMAPWAGRLRRGRVDWGGREARFPLQADGHAWHGTVRDQPWRATGSPGTWETEVTDWLAPCRLRQTVRLEQDRLEVRLEAHAPAPVHVVLGWHPWFRRRLATGGPVEVGFDAGHQLRKAADGVATLATEPVGPGPLDDTLGDIRWPIRLHWPGALDLEVASAAPFAVVYTGDPDAVCIEPQSGPPDGPNLAPDLVTADRPVTLAATWRWRRPVRDG